MNRGAPDRRASHAVGILGSLAAHGLVYAAATIGVDALPSVELDLQRPSQVQFGVVETEAQLPAEPAAEEPAPDPASEETSEAETEPEPEPEPDAPAAASEDAGVRPRQRPTDAGTSRDATAADAGPRLDPRPELAATSPEGTQLALRLDMRVIRESALREEVAALIAAIPDWQQLLDGSGIEPLEDLDRLLVATPDLRLASVVIAGRYRGGRAKAEQAVRNLSDKYGRPAPWSKQRGAPVAPWHSGDGTERVIALLGEARFVIARPADLPRVLAVARELARRRRAAGATDSDAAALLAMEEGVSGSLTVEGAREFVRRGPSPVPTKLHASLRERQQGGASIVARGTFPTAREARAAARYWDGRRKAYAGHWLVRLMDLSRPLEQTTVQAEDDEVHLRAELSTRDTRRALSMLRDRLMAARPLPGASPAAPDAEDRRAPSPRDPPPRTGEPLRRQR